MSVRIRPKQGKTGKRHHVYYRRGGRGFPEEYAGSFHTLKEAKVRRDLVAGELAAGRDPKEILERLRYGLKRPMGLLEAWDVWIASKRKVGEAAKSLYGNSRDRFCPILGEDADPAAITFLDVSAAVDELLGDLAPNTVRIYVSHLAMVLDYALPDGTPNPARSKKLELPSGSVKDLAAPSNDEWTILCAKISARSLPVLRLMECCALRVSEACGVQPGDVDVAGGQFLIRREVTKTKAGRRWVPCPEEFQAYLLSTHRLTPTQVYYDIATACDKAKIRRFGTHAFRRRRISLWYAQGVDGPQVARWAGHSKASESMDTYAFEIVDVLSDEWLGFWESRRSGAAYVRDIEGVSE